MRSDSATAFFPFFSPHVLFRESSWLTYMAVEQAAFVTCNSFRLLEVFNRHFKLKKEEACKKEKKRKKWTQKGEEARRDWETEKGNRNKQGYMKKKNKHTHKKIKVIRLLASSQISAFLLKSVSVVAKSITGWQKHANQGTHRVKLLSEGLRSDTLMYANRNHKQGSQVSLRFSATGQQCLPPRSLSNDVAEKYLKS